MEMEADSQLALKAWNHIIPLTVMIMNEVGSEVRWCRGLWNVEHPRVIVGPRGLALSHNIEDYGQENCAASGLRSHGRWSLDRGGQSKPPEIHPRRTEGTAG